MKSSTHKYDTYDARISINTQWCCAQKRTPTCDTPELYLLWINESGSNQTGTWKFIPRRWTRSRTWLNSAHVDRERALINSRRGEMIMYYNMRCASVCGGPQILSSARPLLPLFNYRTWSAVIFNPAYSTSYCSLDFFFSWKKEKGDNYKEKDRAHRTGS